MTQVQARFVEELSWKERELPQKERTRHVHGIHPYLGKFVPQLVDYFLDRYFEKGDTILDPFCGSGTTLVEANVHSMNCAGVDISEFNILLCKVKTDKYNLIQLKNEFEDIVERVKRQTKDHGSEATLDDYLSENPVAERQSRLDVREASEYLRTWYHPNALFPLLVFRSLISEYEYQDALKVLLSRMARSSRLAPHYELDFPRFPMTHDYQCYKHARICHPTTNAIGFMSRYRIDTYNRIAAFQSIRTDSNVQLISGDSRDISYTKTAGVITSPPYVGLIDYHEQHRYAYELLGLKDRSSLEIGSKKNKESKKAVDAYKVAISQVLSKIVAESTRGPIIFVVNDKRDIYEEIAEMADLDIIERLKRRVDRRTGRRSSGEFFEDVLVMRVH